MKLLTLAILSLTSTSFAATNGIDATFGSGGAVLIGPTPTSNLVLNDIRGIAFQSDGKIIVAGRSIATSGTYVGHIQAAIGRLDADGSWDTTFADHGLFVLPAGSAATPMGGEIKHVAVLSDGSVLGEGGSHHDSFGPLWDTCIVLLKLDSQGAPADFGPAHSGSFCYDLSPTPSSRPSDADGLAVNADGSFYVTSVTTLTHGAVAHFDAGGSLVSGYGTAGVVDLPDQVFTFILTPSPDGGLFATGGQYSGGTNSKIAVVKLRSDGTIDTGYGDNGVFFNDAIAGQVTPSRRIWTCKTGFSSPTMTTSPAPIRIIYSSAPTPAEMSTPHSIRPANSPAHRVTRCLSYRASPTPTMSSARSRCLTDISSQWAERVCPYRRRDQRQSPSCAWTMIPVMTRHSVMPHIPAGPPWVWAPMPTLSQSTIISELLLRQLPRTRRPIPAPRSSA